jgi:hypothetical protein
MDEYAEYREHRGRIYKDTTVFVYLLVRYNGIKWRETSHKTNPNFRNTTRLLSELEIEYYGLRDITT